MSGMGLFETALFLIFFSFIVSIFLIPFVALSVFIARAERRMEKDRDLVILKINKIVEQLRDKHKSHQ